MIENLLDRIATALERIAAAAEASRPSPRARAPKGATSTSPPAVLPGPVPADEAVEAPGAAPPPAGQAGPSPGAAPPREAAPPTADAGSADEAAPAAPSREDLHARSLALVRRSRTHSAPLREAMEALGAKTLGDLDEDGRRFMGEEIARREAMQ